VCDLTLGSFCSEHDPNAFILEGSRAALPDQESDERPKQSLSKSQQRKLRKIEEEKEKRLKRQHILSVLSQHQLGNDELSLFRSISSRGQQESKKEILKRALKMERAGIDVPEDMKLYSETTKRKSFQDEEEEGEDDYETEQSAQDPGRSASIMFEPGNGMEIKHDSLSEAALLGEEVNEEREDPMVPQSNEDMRRALDQAREEIKQAGDMYEEDDDDGLTRQKRIGNVSVKTPAKPRKVVMVERTDEIERVRSSLPIVGMEQEIMEAVSENDVIVLCGETGCGKTTQVPQFLYEGGYSFVNEQTGHKGIIGVTQPRRVAAVSTATRVAEEVGCKIGRTVGYHVRYDRRVSDQTEVQFMTDGILLREVQEDFLLNKYNVLVIDEAHERSLNTDVLLGMLSRVVSLRRQMHDEAQDESPSVMPLKLIIMSATLRIGDFVDNKKLFRHPPPVINVQARQYPVAVHFQKKTELEDYVGAAYKKTCQIHRKLPDGGILVFLTGQREVETLCSKLRKTFNGRRIMQEDGSHSVQPVTSGDASCSLDGLDQGEMQWEDDQNNFDDDNDVDDYEDSAEEDMEEEHVSILNGGVKDYDEQLKLEEVSEEHSVKRVWVLPLYAMLRPDQQQRVFKSVPADHRLIVVATNIAETSLTIPGVRYVVDSGRSKQRLLDSSSGLAKYEVRWISKASADQRAGRSGRMGPGHCYRIFSSAVYNDLFPQFSPPEIYNVDLEGVVLLLKSIGVDNVSNFPFPSPPEAGSLEAAQKCLVALSAIDAKSGALTDIGRPMAQLPISPRHSRMLLEIISSQDVLKKDEISVDMMVMYAIRLTAAMSVESPFVHFGSLQDGKEKPGGLDEDEKTERKRKGAALRECHANLRCADSDALSAMNALCAFEANGGKDAFCRDNFLIFKHLREGLQLTKQLERILRSSRIDSFDRPILNLAEMRKPKLTQAISMALKRAIVAGWGDRIAKRVRSLDYLAKKREQGSKTRAVRYETIAVEEDVFLHPNSSLYTASPEWVVYSDVIRTDKRAYMVGLTSIDPKWIHHGVPQLTTVSEPLTSPSPKYVSDMDCVMAWHDATYGPFQWPLPAVLLPHPDRKEKAAIFAMNILDGTVAGGMKPLHTDLVAPPSMLTSPEMRVHKRVYDLINALHDHGVFCRKDLKIAWEKNPTFLKREIGAWIKKPKVEKFLQQWSAISSL
jgi:ATP-dependent RNA helicase DHX37/DHR1